MNPEEIRQRVKDVLAGKNIPADLRDEIETAVFELIVEILGLNRL